MYKLDHIVLGASSLEEGTEFIESKLDIELSNVGYHDFMGTHNRVAKIDKDIYLEVISINPVSKPQLQNRWFNLDNPTLKENLKKTPQIIGYVVESKDKKIFKYYNSFFQASRGKYKWSFAMPNIESNFLNCELLEKGVVPSLINWKGEKPIYQMKDNQLNLDKLEIQITKKYEEYKDFINYVGAVEKVTLSLKNNLNDFCSNYFPRLRCFIKDIKRNKNILL